MMTTPDWNAEKCPRSIEPGSKASRQSRSASAEPQAIRLGIEHQITARGGSDSSLGIGASLAPFQLEQNRLHVFASAETVDSKVDAGARSLAALKIADFHSVLHAALRSNAEIRKDGMPSIEIVDSESLGARAQPAPIDLVLVARAPVVERRHGGFRAFRSLHDHGRDYLSLHGPSIAEPGSPILNRQ
jgi:hypothetical protein